MLLPALARAKLKAQGISCLNNTKQLGLAWMLYADDNKDVALGAFNPIWVGGGFADPVVGTSIATISNRVNSPTWPYVKSPAVFRCPADKSVLRVGSKLLPRVISFAANAFFGDPSGFVSQASGFRTMTKVSTIGGAGPAQYYVLLDEHENSINDAHFFPFNPDQLVKYPAGLKWLDAPSGRHGSAGGFTFADGHSEIRKWRTPGISKVTKVGGATDRNDLSFLGTVPQQDWQWMVQHLAPSK